MTDSQKTFWGIIAIMLIYFFLKTAFLWIEHKLEIRRIEARAEQTRLENDRALEKHDRIRKENDDRLVLKIRGEVPHE